MALLQFLARIQDDDETSQGLEMIVSGSSYII